MRSTLLGEVQATYACAAKGGLGAGFGLGCWISWLLSWWCSQHLLETQLESPRSAALHHDYLAPGVPLQSVGRWCYVCVSGP